MFEATLKIELGLQEATLNLLKSFAPQRIEITKPVESVKAVVETKAEEPKTEVPAIEEPKAEEPKAAAPTQKELLDKLKETRDRGVSRDVLLNLMKERYGVSVSREIPEDKRAEFINVLNDLK